MKKYDALIIGFGKGGKTLAAALGKKGIKTAVIEKSPLMYGGTCINIGCITTKKLIHTAADAKKNQQADYSEKNNFYAAAIREKNTLTALLRQKNYDNVAAAADIYTGAARFQTDHTVEVQLPDGKTVRVGYADQNGHPYQSIGRWLVAKGELPLEQASMDGIKRWAEANPQRLHELLNSNPSYVFFRELPASSGGPIGALGVPLSAGRSIAVDPRHVPLGAPVFLSTTHPLSATPLQRLVLAQDTGGAIKGVVRADFFWGFGAEAGREAGKMRQQGSMWVLLPNGVNPAAPR